jgi:hypothetical protein
MKEKDGYVNCPEQQVILYVEKEDGNYGPMQTGSYLSGNYLDDYEVKRLHLEEALRNRLLNGEISMIEYYRVLEDLTVAELASRVRLPKSKVKKHLNPAGFGKVRVESLKRYADVFNIPLSFLLQVVMAGNGNVSYTILEEKKQTGGIRPEESRNPFVVLLNLGDTES